MDKDYEHLRLLSIFHYVVGGLAALFSFFPVIHLVIGIVMLVAPESFESDGDKVPAFMGWLFVIGPCIFILGGLILSGMVITTGCFLSKRKHYLFCFVIACIECVFMPYGTILGVFTIITLSKESVKEIFKSNKAILQ